jgi:UDP-N-acetylglucosamine 1-carboxyvinyltransferase
VPSLGGCRIGTRPVDFHIRGLQDLGATLHDETGNAHLTCERLTGNKLHLEYPSVGATEQMILAAVLAHGKTELSNAAIEPEIMDLIMALQKMGAIISVDVDRVITIEGVRELGGYDHAAMPDRLEAASWASAAAATGGRIFVRNARQVDMMTFLNQFRKIGGDFEVTGDGIAFWRRDWGLHSTVLETDVHPGFMTDWQQPFVIALTQAAGVSIVHETVYEERFGYVEALNRMGAQIQLYRECLGGLHCRFGQRNYLHSAVIVGPTPLHGAEIYIPDLRAGFSYVIAALVAEGTSTLTNTSLIQRGYENLIPKLHALGAEVVEAE